MATFVDEPVLVLPSVWPVLRFDIEKLISHVSSEHIFTPFSNTVTSSPLAQLLVSLEVSTTTQFPSV